MNFITYNIQHEMLIMYLLKICKILKTHIPVHLPIGIVMKMLCFTCHVLCYINHAMSSALALQGASFSFTYGLTLENIQTLPTQVNNVSRTSANFIDSTTWKFVFIIHFNQFHMYGPVHDMHHCNRLLHKRAMPID